MRILNPSLITSYSLRGILGPTQASDLELRPFGQAREHGIKVGADLYLMMETDVTPWCEHWGIPNCPAVDFMANIADDQLDEFCERVLSKLETEGTLPVAVTSFIAEISNKDPMSQNTAFVDSIWGKAICTLFRMADRLQANQPRTIVQIVVGSVIDQFKVDETDGAPRFTVSARERDSLMELVLDRLSACLTHVQHHYNIPPDRLRIALELEPGPLYLLRGKESLEVFASAIENHSCALVKKCVGFNLDVAHWWLCRDIRSESDVLPSIRSRIFGAHISGHSPRGHFGDWGLWKLAKRAEQDAVSNQQLETYLHWLKFLMDELQTPHASNYVSIELEAARADEDILASIITLDQWLNNIRLQAKK